jgi:hypothetical protein
MPWLRDILHMIVLLILCMQNPLYRVEFFGLSSLITLFICSVSFPVLIIFTFMLIV